jgi:hypothetical protein
MMNTSMVDQCQLRAGEKSHYQAADCDERRTYQDAQPDEDGILYLRNIIRQAGNKLPGSKLVQIAKRKRLDFPVYAAAQVSAKIDRCAHSEIGAADAADRAEQREPHHEHAGI